MSVTSPPESKYRLAMYFERLFIPSKFQIKLYRFFTTEELLFRVSLWQYNQARRVPYEFKGATYNGNK